MNILVLNAGSSSLKFRLFQMDSQPLSSNSEAILAGGKVERIGESDAQLTLFYGANGSPQLQRIGVESVSEAVKEIVRLVAKPSSEGQLKITIDAVGHRIVHGGARFSEPVRIDDAVLKEIHALTELAPLHNPSGLAGIAAIRSALPGVPNVAVFDTAFHHDLPAVAALYALPAELSERLQLRRYGFHGISYRYVSERLSQLLKNAPTIDSAETRVIICHLGAGASVCALRNGRSVDTSMGFTPLEGLIMGSRSGDVDPGLVMHLLRTGEFTPEELDDMLNHKSGLLGLSGKSGDVRDLEKAASEGHSASQLALECFAYRVRKYIGAYAAALGGVDALAFTGGIGEYSASMRARICHDLCFLGLHIDDECNQNATGLEPAPISGGVGGKVWVVPTDEERQIAREVCKLLG